MQRGSLRKMDGDPVSEALWCAIGQTLRLLVALLLVTALVVMLLHGLNLL